MTPRKNRSNIYILFTLVFVIALGVIIYIARSHTNNVISELTLSRTHTAKQGLVSYLEELKTRAMQRSELIVSRESIKEFIKAGDLESLKETLLEYSAGIDFVSLSDPDGIIIFSSSGDTFDNDMSRQHDIDHIINTGEKSSSISVIPNGAIAVCASAPIYDGDTLIGIINCNFDLTKSEYLDIFKERTGCEATIFIDSTRVATTLTNSRGRLTGTQADEKVTEAVIVGGETYVDIMEIYGNSYGAHYSPLKTDDKIIGMLFTGINVDSIVESQRVTDAWILAVSVSAIAIVMGFGVIINRFALKNELSFRELSEKTASLDVMEKLLQSMEALILITELDTDNTIFVNAKMEKEFGLADSGKGRKCWELFQPDVSERCAFCPKNDPGFISGDTVVWENHNSVTNRYY